MFTRSLEGRPRVRETSGPTPPASQIDAPISVNGSDDVLVLYFPRLGKCCSGWGCWARTRQGRATPGGGQALIRSRGQRVWCVTGGGRQIVRRPAPGCGSRLEGQAGPGLGRRLAGQLAELLASQAAAGGADDLVAVGHQAGLG